LSRSPNDACVSESTCLLRPARHLPVRYGIIRDLGDPHDTGGGARVATVDDSTAGQVGRRREREPGETAVLAESHHKMWGARATLWIISPVLRGLFVVAGVGYVPYGTWTGARVGKEGDDHMSAEENKAIVRRLYEGILIDGNLDIVDELLAD